MLIRNLDDQRAKSYDSDLNFDYGDLIITQHEFMKLGDIKNTQTATQQATFHATVIILIVELCVSTIKMPADKFTCICT